MEIGIIYSDLTIPQSVSGAVGDDTPYVEYNYTDLSGIVNNSRLTSIVYPDGYTVDYNYSSGLDNDISRLSYISDFTGTLQSYQYLGLDTIVVMAEPQADIELTYLTTDDGTGDAGDEYTGLDRFGRVAEQNWYNTSTSTSIVDIQYGYDDDGNVLYQNNTLESTQSELFTYDNLGQLTSYEQGTLSDDNTVIASPSISETWGYDALGNHLTDTTKSVTITSTFNYDNQITSISSGTTPTYDADGNMTEDQSGLTYTYDAWGHEIDVYSGMTLEESYSYDGRGFRMTNTVGSTTTNLYNSTDEQVLEEQGAGTGYYTTRYVWSQNYVNQMVSRDTDTSGTGLTASGDGYSRIWPVADANFNTVALVVMSDGSATVEERYAYDPFGTVTYMTGSYGSESSSAYGWVYLFQGGRLDTITEDTNFDARNENSTLGTWTSEDPSGFGGGSIVLNGFEGNSPINSTDPYGLAVCMKSITVNDQQGAKMPKTKFGSVYAIQTLGMRAKGSTFSLGFDTLVTATISNGDTLPKALMAKTATIQQKILQVIVLESANKVYYMGSTGDGSSELTLAQYKTYVTEFAKSTNAMGPVWNSVGNDDGPKMPGDPDVYTSTDTELGWEDVPGVNALDDDPNAGFEPSKYTEISVLLAIEIDATGTDGTTITARFLAELQGKSDGKDWSSSKNYPKVSPKALTPSDKGTYTWS